MSASLLAKIFHALHAAFNNVINVSHAITRSTDDMHFTLDFIRRNAHLVFMMSSLTLHDDVLRDVMREPESESFPRFFDKNQRIRLALFFEMLTMTLNMGFMIIKLVKLKQPSRVGN